MKVTLDNIDVAEKILYWMSYLNKSQGHLQRDGKKAMCTQDFS